MTLTYPPNPYEPLDRSVRDAPPGTPSPKRGRDFFLFNSLDRRVRALLNCHALPTGDNNTVVSRLTLLDSQDMKVPQLRNLYTKTGFTDAPGAVNKKGFGYMHDGAVDNVFDFLKFPGFDFGADPIADATPPRRRGVPARVRHRHGARGRRPDHLRRRARRAGRAHRGSTRWRRRRRSGTAT